MISAFRIQHISFIRTVLMFACIWTACMAGYDKAKDLQTSETGHGGYGGTNYQYAAVPHYGAWEFGYKRGNPYHFQERHEVGRGHNFKTKVRWGDKHGGYGEQFYDYNHADKGYGGKGYGG